MSAFAATTSVYIPFERFNSVSGAPSSLSMLLADSEIVLSTSLERFAIPAQLNSEKTESCSSFVLPWQEMHTLLSSVTVIFVGCLLICALLSVVKCNYAFQRVVNVVEVVGGVLLDQKVAVKFQL